MCITKDDEGGSGESSFGSPACDRVTGEGDTGSSDFQQLKHCEATRCRVRDGDPVDFSRGPRKQPSPKTGHKRASVSQVLGSCTQDPATMPQGHQVRWEESGRGRLGLASAEQREGQPVASRRHKAAPCGDLVDTNRAATTPLMAVEPPRSPPAVTQADRCSAVPPVSQHMLEVSRKEEVTKRPCPMNQAVRATSMRARAGEPIGFGAEREKSFERT